MPADPLSSHRPAFDDQAVRRLWQRQAAADAPWLHGEVARRMAERLALILRTPTSIVEWWAHAGASDALLAAAYPKAERVLVEPSAALAARSARALAAPWWSARRWTGPAARVSAEDGLAAGAAQLLWSNLTLHQVADPPATMQRWKRALADDGFLMFSTFGPDTLLELRALYDALGFGPAMLPFVDMHDLGDMLVQAGFADPVMDQEKLVLTWTDADALLAELRTLGGNADPARYAGLRTPRWRRRLADALAARAGADGRISMSFEIVYGHAFNAPPRAAVAARTEVALDDMRRMVRSGRPGAVR